MSYIFGYWRKYLVSKTDCLELYYPNNTQLNWNQTNLKLVRMNIIWQYYHVLVLYNLENEEIEYLISVL